MVFTIKPEDTQHWNICHQANLKINSDLTNMYLFLLSIKSLQDHPVVADLSATLAPLAGKAVVNTPRWVFSPEYRQQVARPGAEKEVGGILREIMMPEGELTPERLHDGAHG